MSYSRLQSFISKPCFCQFIVVREDFLHDWNVHLHFFIRQVLELVLSTVRGRFAFSCHKLDMHERVSTLDCDRATVITQVYEFKGKSASESAVDFGRVQEG